MPDFVELPVLLRPDGEEQTPDSGLKLYVEARRPSGEQPVAFGIVEGLGDVTDAISIVAGRVADALRSAGPDKYTVEMGFELKAEAGKLVALLAHGGATATINITLEWEKAKATAPR